MWRRSSLRRTHSPAAFLLVAAACVLAVYAGQESRGSDGKRFYVAGEPDRLAWVSAEMATSENGQIDWSSLSETVRTSYEEIRRWQPIAIGHNADGSPLYDPWQSHALPGFGAYWGPSHYDALGEKPSDTLEELIENARYVVEGVVTKQEQGFFFDEPMTLLTLEVARIAAPTEDTQLSARHLTPLVSELYVAYPAAHFTIGGHGFAKGDPGYPPLPGVGDKILFFEFTLALDVDRLIFRPEADKILVQPAGGALNPRSYQQAWVERRKRKVPATIEEVAEKVAARRDFLTVGPSGGAP